MSLHVRLFLYFIAIVVLLIWSLQQDDYIGGRLISGLICSGLFAIFGLCANRSDIFFIISWTLATCVFILFSFCWDGGYEVPWPVPGTGLLVLAVSQTARIYFLHLTLSYPRTKLEKEKQQWPIDDRQLSLLFLALSFFIFLVCLAKEKLTPHRDIYAFVLYFYIVAVPLDFYLYGIKRPSIRTLYQLLLYVMTCIFIVLITRQWISYSTVPWCLIVQPMISVCIAQILYYIREVEFLSLI